jgi:Domain of unknown function (DUF4388)
MSLVGSLEDLGLGDILQIIHLSRKSGTLWIRSDAGEGQVVFREGVICGAFTKDGPAELRDLLLAAGALPAADLEAAGEEARARGVPLGSILEERGALASEGLDEILRAHIESSVLGMFTWTRGEFSFEIQERADHSGEDLFLRLGLNPQFLALEGTRLHDEARSGAEAAGEAMSVDSLRFGHEEEAPTELPLLVGEEVEAVGEEEVVADLIEGDDFGSATEAEPTAPLDDPELAVPAAAAPAAQAPARPSAAPAPSAVVAIDDDLSSLEWLKAALAPAHPRVHIFQRSDQGISRIRQYLARGGTPLVVLSAEAPPDPVSGARDAAEIIRRLKLQAPRMPVFLTRRAGDEAAPPRGADGVLRKPSSTQLADPRCAPERERIAEELRASLRDQLACALDPGASGGRPAATLSPDALARLRTASARLRDPASRGDVLSLVIRFAAEIFSRVAVFMVREEHAVGLAQIGLPKAGGPDDAGIAEVVVPHREPAWFRAVLGGRNPVRAAPEDEGDQRLAVLLGNGIPAEAYVAPIESGESVVALLYADNLPGGEPIGDTSALEVILHEAGLALERALLERALAEAEEGA